MKYRILPLFVLFMLLCILCCNCFLPKKEKNTSPNIILFYADDLGWMDLGIQGSEYYETPNIDRLAKEGMRFTNAYANAANCAPSRASLMTGLYTPRHGIYTVGNPDRGKTEHRRLISIENKIVLDSNLLTLPAYFKKQGYQTCMAGKWHLSKDPTEYGFDTNFGGFKAGYPKSYFSPYKNPNLEDGPVGEHLPSRLAKEVSNWIEQSKDQPFFAYFSFYSVHTPIQAREDLMEKYQQKEQTTFHNKPKYAAMIEAMDLAVGEVLETVEQHNLSKETIIIFTSDNGAHGGQTLSRPLRGSKGMFYEGGIRVPLIVKWEGETKPNSENHAAVIGSDLLPTFVEMIEGKVEEKQFDGRSILKLLKGKDLPERPLFWHFPAYLESYKSDRAFEDSHDKPWFRTAPVGVIRKGDWKLLEFFETGDLELYNLNTDIGEQHNLAKSHLEQKEELYQDLLKWRASVNAPVPKELNPAFVEF